MAATYDALLRINAKATGAGEVKNLGNAIGALSKSAAGLGAIAGSITGLGVALGGIGLAAAGKGIIDMADSLDELSQRSGASVESLSKLGVAARMSGLDTEQVSLGLVRLSRNLGEIAAGGGKDAKAALDQLGVSAFNASGELRKPDEVMFDLIDSLAKLEDGGTKTRLTMELLGRGSAALIPMFNMGAEAIKGLNTGISEEFAKNAGIYNDRMEALKMQFTALGVTVLDQLLPSMIKGTEFIGGLISSAQGWLKENEGALGAFVKGIASAAVEVAKIAGPVLIAVAAYKAYQSAVAAAAFIQGAFNAATVANPIGLLAMAVGLGIGAVAMGNIAVAIKKAREEGDKLGGSSVDFAKALKDAEDNLEQITLKQRLAAEAAEAQKAAAEALRKTEEDRTYWLERAGSAYEKQAAQIDLISAAQQRRTALAGEENTLAQAYNNLGKTILQNRLELAKTDEEKLAIGRQIMDMEIQSARLQREATELQIRAEEELAAASVNRAISNRKEIESTLALASAMYNAGQIGIEKINDLRFKLEEVTGAANTAQLNLNQARQVGGTRRKLADVNFQSASLQASGNFQQMQTSLPNVNREPRWYLNTPNGVIPQYAKGGYVTRPTLAMIGEGGEPEYVVPKSKAKAFANNIASGRTGEQALKPSWREIALETLANSPGDYMRASSAIMTGWRQRGGLQNAANEPILRKRAIESLGFKVGPSAHWGGGGFTIKGRPSLASIRGELEDLRARRSGGMSPGQASITLNTRIDKVVRQDGEDKVTFAQAQALASDAARQAVAQMDGNLKSPTYRQKRGIR
jgi:hypothetical protein